MTKAQAVREMTREQEQQRLNDFLEIVRIEALRKLVQQVNKDTK